MQIDPISARTRRAAVEAFEEMREYYKIQAFKRLSESNYLRLLGEIVKLDEEERRKNLDLFARFKRGG